MKNVRRQRSSRTAATDELARLRARLAEAEQTIQAIRTGEIDAVVISGKNGPRVFTLQGAEHEYRVLIESINEGALTLTAGKIILYANRCFAQMVKCPLERLMGTSFHRFLPDKDRAKLRFLLKHGDSSGLKSQVQLNAWDGSKIPAQISIRPLEKSDSNRAAFGVVVTDMTVAQNKENVLRTLSHSMVLTQEAERGRVAVELHDRVTQLLCASLVLSHTLAERISRDARPLKKDAVKLRKMLGETAGEVERISRGLRPGVLKELGLVALLRDTSRQFAERTGVSLKMDWARLRGRLPADTELTLYRILQEALSNVERHARARHVNVRLSRRTAFVQLAINDDGIGFDPEVHLARRNGNGGLGLLGMQERARYVGGALNIESALGAGTTVDAQFPLVRGPSEETSPVEGAG